MKNSKKTRRGKKPLVVTAVLFAAAAVLLLTTAVGGTYAALRYYSETYHADFSIFDIGVTLLEDGEPVSWRNYTGADDAWYEHNGTLLTGMLQEGEELEIGKTYPTSLTVQNSGTIDEYVRVRVFKYWEDAQGNKLTNLDPNQILLGLGGEGWMENAGETTAERTVLYYQNALPSGGTTPAFCTWVKINTAVCNRVTENTYVDDQGYQVIETIYHYDDARFVVKAQVDAVQTHNAQDAFMSAWGVTAQFDEQGHVTSVE